MCWKYPVYTMKISTAFCNSVFLLLLPCLLSSSPSLPPPPFNVEKQLLVLLAEDTSGLEEKLRELPAWRLVQGGGSQVLGPGMSSCPGLKSYFCQRIPVPKAHPRSPLQHNSFPTGQKTDVNQSSTSPVTLSHTSYSFLYGRRFHVC